jgi:hypothetical protein
MSATTASLSPLPRPFSRLRGLRICAYCAEPATHVVYAIQDDDSILGAAFCCDEPTHWTWLVDDVEELEREEERW